MDGQHVDSANLEQQLARTDCGRRIARLKWSQDVPGNPADWPRSLATLVVTMLECPVSMLVAWGPDLICLFNDAYKTAVGDHANGAMGKPLPEHWSEGWDEIGPLVRDAMTGQAHKLANVPLSSMQDGTTRESWWDFSVSPLRDDSGAVAGVLCLAAETTELVLAGRTRQAASERLREALAAGIPIGSWDWDVVNDLSYSDSQFALIYCVEPERAAAGAPMQDYMTCVHPDDRSRVQAQIDAAIATGEPYLSEYRIIGADGEMLWVSAQGTPVMDDDGRCVRLPGLAFDITATKKRRALV